VQVPRNHIQLERDIHSVPSGETTCLSLNYW